jgi:hypothetical protein
VLREPVRAPESRSPQYGLIVAAPELTEPNKLDALASGWKFNPENCGNSNKLPVLCAGNTADMAIGTADGKWNGDEILGDPIWIYAEDRCSSLGNGNRDWQGRARRQLTAVESYELADELWSGTVTQAATPDLENRWLAGPADQSDTLTSSGVTPVAALGCITQGLAEGLKGQQGMVHVTPQMLQHLAADSIITKQGNLWVTAMGHIVVADAGYDGSGPDGAAAGATQWIYGTPMIRVRLGTVEVIPGDLADAKNLAMALDYPVNTIAVYAGRLAGYQWDNECTHLAAEVSLPICLVGGAG